MIDFELEETSGSTFTDSTSAALVATAPVGGFAVGSAGHSGKAVNFSGGVLVVAATPKIPDVPTIVVEAWIQPQAPVNASRVIAAKAGAYVLRQVNSDVSFTVNGTGSATPCVASTTGGIILPSGSWYHVLGWYDGLAVTVEVNGYLTGTASCPNGPLVPTPLGAFTMGGLYSGGSVAEPYQGAIDEVRVRSASRSLVSPGGFGRPIVWSGGCSTYGQPATGTWAVYCLDSIEFNTAVDYFTAAPNGTITFKVPGYYRIKMYAAANNQAPEMAFVKNGVEFAVTLQRVVNTWIDIRSDQVWPFAAGDTLSAQFFNGGGTGYAYYRWNANGRQSRLQIEYVGGL